MNFARFLFLSKTAKQNKLLLAIKAMKKHLVFKGAKFELYTPTLNPDHLVVVFGQSHPVLTGKINNKQLKQIAGCQSRLVLYYAYFHSAFGIQTYGGEGLHGDAHELYLSVGNAAPMYESAMKQFFPGVEKAKIALDQMHQVARKVIFYFGGLWRDALRMKDDKNTRKYAQAVDGQAFYDFLTPANITVYPVEGEKQYQHVLQNVRKLEQEIVSMENNYDFRVAKSKLGKTRKMSDFSQKELDLIKKHQSLVKRFNKVLGSDFRERATLELMRERAEGAEIAVFTMGVAHRKNYFKLVNSFLKNTRTAFLFVRAPELRPKYWLQILVLLGVLVGLGLLWSWLT
jgi:hypothetical protein